MSKIIKPWGYTDYSENHRILHFNNNLVGSKIKQLEHIAVYTFMWDFYLIIETTDGRVFSINDDWQLIKEKEDGEETSEDKLDEFLAIEQLSKEMVASLRETWYALDEEYERWMSSKSEASLARREKPSDEDPNKLVHQHSLILLKLPKEAPVYDPVIMTHNEKATIEASFISFSALGKIAKEATLAKKSAYLVRPPWALDTDAVEQASTKDKVPYQVRPPWL